MKPPSAAPGLEDRGLIGEGGWGQVRRVHDRALDRDLAMKRLHPEVAERGPIVARFLTEARITARLDHPAIVPVHQLGRGEDGAWFFTMKEVRGITLTQAMERRAARDPSWPLERVVEGFRRACEGVAFAHARGVVHRDLKPPNIMLGPFGEAYVLDWGIARDERATEAAATDDDGAGPLRTLAGRALGTPGYMSPEHAGLGTFSPRTDVWSLGAILHEILAGDVPTAGNTVDELVAAARKGAVRHTPGPPELASVARRALARDPSARHPDAGAFAEDLAAWLAGREVPSHRYSLVARGWRWAVARRGGVLAVLAAGAVAGLASAAFAVVVAIQWWWAASAEREARINLGHLLATTATAARIRGTEPDATLLALAALEQLDDPRARGVLAAAPRPANLRFERTLGEKCRDLQWHDGALWCAEEFTGLARIDVDGAVTHVPRAGGTSHVSWSTGGLRLESSRTTPDLRVYDGETVVAHDVGHDRWTRALAFVGEDVWSSGQDGVLRRWDARAGTVRDTVPVGFPVERLVRGPDGGLVVVDRSGDLHRYTAGGAVSPLAGGGDAWVVESSPSGARVAAGSWIGGSPGFRVWDVRTGSVIGVPVLPNPVTALRWTSDDELWVGDQTGLVHRCVLGAARCEALRVDERPVYGIARDGDLLATLGLFGRLRVWSVPQPGFERVAHGVGVLLSTPSGWWVGGRDQATRFDGDGSVRSTHPWCAGEGILLDDGGGRACHADGVLAWWPATGVDPAWTRPSRGHVHHLVRTDTGVVTVGEEVVSWSADGVPTALPTTAAPGHDAAAAVGPWLAVATAGQAADTVDLLDLRTGATVDHWTLDVPVVALALAAGEERPIVFAATSDGSLRRWGPDGVQSQPLGASLEALALDPDTGRLVLGRNGSELVVLPAFGASPSHVVGLPTAVTHVAFGRDAQVLVALSDDSLVALALDARPTRADVETRSGAALDEDGLVRLASP